MTEVAATNQIAIEDLIRDATRRLRSAGIDSAQTDSIALLAVAWRTSIKTVRLRLLAQEAVPAIVAQRFYGVVARRVKREPLQHIVGHAPFRYLDLKVGPGVFVPRPETELLVEPILTFLTQRHEERATVLDLCTGAGPLALSVATETRNVDVLGFEISPAALEYANENAHLTQRTWTNAGNTVTFRLGDVRALPTRAGGHSLREVDVVVSNPPYVPEHLQPDIPEVVRYDPRAALYGGGIDGMVVPRAVIDVAGKRLRPGGLLVMEHTEAQGELVRAGFLGAGFTSIATKQDYTGRDRLTVALKA